MKITRITRIFALALLIVFGVTAAVAPSVADQNRDVAHELQTQKADAERPEGYRTQSSATYTAQATTTGCWADPTNDTMNASTGQTEPYPKADLVQWCATYSGGNITLTHRNATPTSPTSDPNWINGITGLLFDIDVHGDSFGEYGVYYLNSGSGVVVEIERYSDGVILCSGTGTYDGSTYAAKFASSCIGNPARIWTDAFMVYDSQWDDQYAPLYGDIADTFGGPVEPTSTAPAQPTQPAPAPAPDGDDSKYFADVTGGPHVANIDFMYEQGLVNGCGTDPLRYCPSANMTRAQMATILARYIQQNP